MMPVLKYGITLGVCEFFYLVEKGGKEQDITKSSYHRQAAKAIELEENTHTRLSFIKEA